MNRVLVTITLEEFHSHGYMTVPSLWQYPDVAREYDWIDCVVDNCSLIFVSIENLKKAKRKFKRKFKLHTSLSKHPTFLLSDSEDIILLF